MCNVSQFDDMNIADNLFSQFYPNIKLSTKFHFPLSYRQFYKNLVRHLNERSVMIVH